MLNQIFITGMYKVLIESDWNLKSFSASNNSCAFLSINRIRLEIKATFSASFGFWSLVLIESDWNLKPVTVETVAVRMPVY